MKILKWIGVFFLYWIVGTFVSMGLEMALFFSGINTSGVFLGLVIMATIVFGLLHYGRSSKTKGSVGA